MRFIVFSLLLFILLMPLCIAHVPQTAQDNDSIEHALEVRSPLKSWVYYDSIDIEQTARYYMAHYEKGQKIYVSTLTPDGGEFTPSIIIYGPGLQDGNTYPAYIELFDTPELGTHVYYGFKENAEYEPFTPGAYYHTAETTLLAPETGMYYFIIYAEGTGPVALAIGYVEGFTPLEIIKVPIDTIIIHRWEGQSYAMILLPFIIVSLAVSILALDKLRRESLCACHIVAIVSGALFIGSTAYTIFQMGRASMISGIGPSVAITVIFAGLSFILGLSLIKWGLLQNVLHTRDRIRFLGYALFGTVIFSGMILGPLLCIVVAAMPCSIAYNGYSL